MEDKEAIKELVAWRDVRMPIYRMDVRKQTAVFQHAVNAIETLARIRAAIPYDQEGSGTDVCARCLELMENGTPDDGQTEHLICDQCAQGVVQDMRKLLEPKP